MSHRLIHPGSFTRFLDRDHRYLLLTIILSVSLFLLFGRPEQRNTVTPGLQQAQASYSPLPAPVIGQTAKLQQPDSPTTSSPDNTFDSGIDSSKTIDTPATTTAEVTDSPDKTQTGSSPTEPQVLAKSKPRPKNNSTALAKTFKTPAKPAAEVTDSPVRTLANNSLNKYQVVAQSKSRPSARDIDEHWQRYIIRKGDTLSRIFRQLQLPQVLALNLSQNHPGSLLRRLRPGRILYYKTTAKHDLIALSYAFSTENTLEIRQQAADYQALISPKPVEIVQKQSNGSITSSLGQATRKQHVPASVMLQLVEIFGWDIDFGQDLRKGDSFNVLWQQARWQGKTVRNGPVLAAEFVNDGTRYRAVRFTNRRGKTAYYAPDGSSLRRSFLKTPVKFSRISSGFSLRRFHPKLKKWRAHHGVDYAAKRGTAVRSTADGTVLFKGWKGGYGRTVIIRHGGPYSTLYAHLSKFSRGLRSGSHVNQGDIVAYVGSSGLATGPHLHYEFRVNGKYKNPVTFHPPRAVTISKNELPAFRNSTRLYLAKLETEQQIQVVANR